MRLNQYRQLHEDMGVGTRDIFTGTTLRPHSHMWSLFGIVVVALLPWWAWLWCAIDCKFHGVLIRDRGKKRAPVVLLDWETYSRMVVGLKPETLKSILPPVDGQRDDMIVSEVGGLYP